jgi:hypothetical protein
MRTPRETYSKTPTVYTCELDACPRCGGPLVEWSYVSGPKTVQTLATVLTIAHRPKHCAASQCTGYTATWKSVRWQQIAPRYCTYGYDVIAQIGWQRQTYYEPFEAIHRGLAGRLQISESQVRYLYHQQYLPLLACHERQYLECLRAVSERTGLILGLDGLSPEGGEPQLWVVRELQLQLTLRSGWLSQQDQTTFVNFLQPIADWGLRVAAVISDKQRGLEPAVPIVFPDAKHGFCQGHYLKNAADPVAEMDEAMKVSMRKAVRDEVGPLIRQEKVEKPGVLTVTGLLPSPLEPTPPQKQPPTIQNPPDPVTQEREAIVQDLMRRVRYLLTLKGRPPFRLAGIEMFERLTEVVTCLDMLINHYADPRLVELRQGLHNALRSVRQDYTDLRQVADWLLHIADLLDPEGKPARSGAAVRQELFAYLTEIQQQSQNSSRLEDLGKTIRQVSLNYDKGLFHCYDVPELPRTNNDRESEFRDLNRRLLRTTGQKGLVRRLIQREGAWELISRPDSLQETTCALSKVDPEEFRQEQQRVRNHRNRFRLHTRSPKQSQAQLKQLEQRWVALPLTSGP